MATKTFEDLIKDVHERGICQQCGGCVSFCSSAEYDIINFVDPYSPPVYINEDDCLECGICYYICPQTRVLDDELNKIYLFEGFSSMPIGNYLEIYSCQSNDKDFLKNGTDGGIVNTIINYLLEIDEIDGSIVSKTEAPFSREAIYAKNKEELIDSSGTQLNISPQLIELQKFSTYTHTIPELKNYKFNKLALVGTPCQIYSIRCMQSLGVTPSENVKICLGLFCYENFLFDRSQLDKFEKDFNIEFEKIKKINMKEDLIFQMGDNQEPHKEMHIPFNYMKDYMRVACNACDDFTNIYADISFGGLGSPKKYTTVIIRTEKGKLLFQKVRDAGLIKLRGISDDEIFRIQNILSAFSKKKIERKEKFMKNLNINLKL
ncbi:MAG: Coenzyme F420 hydrogenase subunit beta [Promethearchaeota archaeon]|nr:MAG: Coenzyme F420 hydrogenase subunit beta [Candidatus Lokiarchaeota archaeon]